MEELFKYAVSKNSSIDTPYNECSNGHGLMMINDNQGYICKICGEERSNINDLEYQDFAINSSHNTYGNSGQKITITGNNLLAKNDMKNSTSSYCVTQKRNSQNTIDKLIKDSKEIASFIGKEANIMFDRIVQYSRNNLSKDNVFDDDYDEVSMSTTPNRSEKSPHLSNIFDNESVFTLDTEKIPTRSVAATNSTNLTSSTYATYLKSSIKVGSGTRRSKVRLGIMAACMHYAAIRNGKKYPSQIILKHFGIEEKYLTRGCTELRKFHELGVIVLPIEEDDEITSFINKYIAKVGLDESPNTHKYKNFVYNLICQINDKCILGKTSSKTSTRCAGIIYILMKALSTKENPMMKNTDFAKLCDDKSFSSIKTYIETIEPYIMNGCFKPVFNAFSIPFSTNPILKERKKKEN